MVGVESNSGHARQSRRRRHFHGACDLRHAQAADGGARAAAGAGTSTGGMSEAGVKVVGAGSRDFDPEQRRYLEGFVAGAQIAKAAKNLSGGAAAASAPPEPIGPDAA